MESTETKDDVISQTEGRGVLGKSIVEQLKLLAVFLFAALLFYWSRPDPTVFAIGVIFVAAGTLVRVWAAGHLTRDQKLTVSGPYEFTRNPFYFGRFLLIIGFAVMSGLKHPVLVVVFVAAMVIFFFYYMPRKEKREGGRLNKLFGEDYSEWKKNVPELFPRITPYVMRPKKWESALYFGNSTDFTGNKEIWTTIAMIALVALFYWKMVGPLPEFLQPK